MVGFLFLYPAFVAKSHDASGWEQLRILGLIGAAAAIGNFAGNFTSARLKLGHPAQLVVRAAIAVTVVALATALTGNLLVAAFATLVTSGASAIAKASLDASMQDDLPEESRASAFGRSESLLQLGWVAGGATGVLIYTDLWVGFTAISAVAHPRPGADVGELQRRLADPRVRRQPAGVRRAGGHARRLGDGGAASEAGSRGPRCGRGAGVGGHRRADLAADARPRLRASGDQRLHPRPVGAGRAVPVLRRLRRSPGATSRRPSANSTSRRATRCSCRCRRRSRGRRGCCCAPTRIPATAWSRSSGPTASSP